MSQTPLRQLDWLRTLARFFIEREVAELTTQYAPDIVSEIKDSLEQQLEFANMTFEERYGADLARRLREQQKYLKNARLSDRWSRSREFRNFPEVLNEIMRLRDSNSNPLRWSEYLLYVVLPKEERETVPGDLLEEYQTVILPKFGVHLARIWFLKQVAASIWPFLKRRFIKLLGIATLVKFLH